MKVLVVIHEFPKKLCNPKNMAISPGRLFLFGQQGQAGLQGSATTALTTQKQPRSGAVEDDSYSGERDHCSGFALFLRGHVVGRMMSSNAESKEEEMEDEQRVMDMENGLESTIFDTPETDGKGSKSKTIRKRWDFRYGEMPEGVTVHAHKVLQEAKAESPLSTLHKPEDAASFLSLNPMTFLHLDLKSLESSTEFKEWTITLDIKLNDLPRDTAMGILQCHDDPKQPARTVEAELYPARTVEAELYPVGAIGIFEEISQKTQTFLKPHVWNRVSLRFGGSPKALSVFVNGKLSVGPINKGVMASTNRFHVPAAGFLLLAAQDPLAIPGGAHIRWIEFQGSYLQDNEVRKSQHGSVYSQWLTEARRDRATLLSALSLAPLYKRPPMAWSTHHSPHTLRSASATPFTSHTLLCLCYTIHPLTLLCLCYTIHLSLCSASATPFTLTLCSASATPFTSHSALSATPFTLSLCSASATPFTSHTLLCLCYTIHPLTLLCLCYTIHLSLCSVCYTIHLTLCSVCYTIHLTHTALPLLHHSPSHSALPLLHHSPLTLLCLLHHSPHTLLCLLHHSPHTLCSACYTIHPLTLLCLCYTVHLTLCSVCYTLTLLCLCYTIHLSLCSASATPSALPASIYA
eukprot:g61981.t1